MNAVSASVVKTKPVFITGRKVNLRPFSVEDAPVITRWINNPDVRYFFMGQFPRSERYELDWINKQGEDASNIVLCIETLDGHPIGSMGLHRIDWISRHATTGALIGEKEYWGQGYGTDAKMHLLNYAFNVLNLNRICSNVFAFNERSIRYSLHCGYQIEGRRRQQHFQDGKYWDVVELGLLREEWQPLWDVYRREGKLPSKHI